MARRAARRSASALPAARPSDTAAKLVAAATKEFNRRGFDGTDTDRIARQAGFAPQTFYRWFRDKTAIFVAVYHAWEDEEQRVVARMLAENAPMTELVRAIGEHHRAYRIFRRSLRQLAVEEPVVREARAASRKRQVERIQRWSGLKTRSPGEIVASLLRIERLCDAIAEGELADLGIDDETGRTNIVALLAQLRG